MLNTGRRNFIAGLVAATVTPKATWADAGSPSYLSAARTSNGAYALCGFGADLDLTFQIPLPTRGHAAAAHPTRAQAVAFARRPGTYAVVIDCVTGDISTMLSAPEGRHFYGHGTFSADGTLLFTTENDYENGRGCIGVWDVRRGYLRVDEWNSGGIGPHDIKRLPGSDVLVLANGGIDTHPETGRTKLNIPTMRSNLSYIQNSVILDQVELGEDHQRNSIRHLAVRHDGLVAFGMQWQGDDAELPLAGVHLRGSRPSLLRAQDTVWATMNSYVGSIAFNKGGDQMAVTSPRGGTTLVFDLQHGLFAHHAMDDVCGVAPFATGFVASTGTGSFFELIGSETLIKSTLPLAMDNHLVPIAGSSLIGS